MTEQNTLSSVVEFDSDISTAEKPKPLPAGVYKATIVGAEVKMSKAGNRYASVTMKVSAEDYPADYVEGNKEGTSLRYNRLVLENTAPAKYALRKFCQTVGLPMSTRIDVNEWIGSTCKIEVANSLYEGEPRAEIARLVD